MFHFGKDRLDRGGPNEGFGIGVGEFDVLVDCGDKVRHAWESPSSDPLLRDLAEPAFDHVQPRGRRWDEMEEEPRVFCEPCLHRGVIGSCIIVENEMKIEAPGGLSINCAQKAKEF